MCRCVRVGGSGCMLGGRPWAASAGPPAAEIFAWFQIRYPRSCTQICCAIFLWSHLSVENRSLVNFSKGNEHYGGDLHENGCLLHVKRVAAECYSPNRVLRVFREIRFYLHKDCRAAEIGFSLHKECLKNNQKINCMLEIFPPGGGGKKASEKNDWPPNPKRYFLEQQLQIRAAFMFQSPDFFAGAF